MDVLRKQEILPQLPKLDKYETKSCCRDTWQASLTETENWRERLSLLADATSKEGLSLEKDKNFFSTLTHNGLQGNCISAELKLATTPQQTDFSRILSEHSFLPWRNKEPGREMLVTETEEGKIRNSKERNILYEDKDWQSYSKLPSFEILSAIGQKEDSTDYQGRCSFGEAVTRTPAASSSQVVERNNRVTFHDSSILHSINSPIGLGQPRNDNNSCRTSSSDENLYSIRQLPWNESARTRNYDCVEPYLGVSIYDEQRRFGENPYSMSTSPSVYEEPHPLVTLRSTEGLTQEQKQLRRILKNRWSAKMSRMKRNEQIRRLEFKSSEQEKIIRELLEERDSLKNEISLLKKQMEQQQNEHVSGSS
ncbi:hypothetical protein GpartN1_g1635.t1 [Galdieria partita]|uniref:BZIP domain-containing protein n=1 Tax=Galdieria partita TaxID=83374 RepID=A0A9C7PT67_9RHOD|nr:hypothetical protein GpartN1_g1635.t1 [Galdieria partita]